MDSYSQKILITGASGVIGNALYQELQSQGYNNIVTLTSAQTDLRDVNQTMEFFKAVKPVIVFHLAALVFGIMGNLKNKARSYLDNTRINTNVIDASYQVGVKKIIAMGSSAIYSDSISIPMKEECIWDGAPHYSEASYAHSKRSMLAQLEAYKDQYGMDYAFCVSTNLYGPHDRFDETCGHVIPSLISKFHQANTLQTNVNVWGTGQAKRDFLFSQDAAIAMRLIAEKFSGSINLASGESYTIRETVEMIKRISFFKKEIQWDSSKPDGQHVRKYDVSKLATLGFKPKHTLETGLEKTYHWFNQNLTILRR